MAINLLNTKDVQSNGLKMLVYGQAGSGKTSLIPTLPNPIILSAESGLLSIAGANIPYIEIKSIQDLKEAYTYISEGEGKSFESVALDSITEIAEVILHHEKKVNKDARASYGAMQDQIAEIIRAFRDLPKRNVYFTAKLEKSIDELGMVSYAPSMPSQKTTQGLAYYFDLVMALRIMNTPEGKTYRTLMTESDGFWQAKKRGYKLDQYEEPHLGKIIGKIK